MKGIVAVFHVVLTSILFADEIPWPVGVTLDGQDSSWTLMHSYGDFHGDWELVTQPTGVNFHSGIDISDYWCIPDPDPVRCVRSGVVTHVLAEPILGSNLLQYLYVICDEQLSVDGWSYGHLDTAIPEGEPVAEGEVLSTMDPDIDLPHLHFMRSHNQYEHTDPGLVNPLEQLVPQASAGGSFTWDFSSTATEMFFLEEMLHLDWPKPVFPDPDPDEVWQYLVPPDALHGSVDLFFAYKLTGIGSRYDPYSIEFPLNAFRLSWSLSELLTGPELLWTRYVAEFSGQLGASADSTRFREHYFRWTLRNWLFSGEAGLITCLTNCSDAASWNGISNIEENCWNTALALDGDGENYNPLIQQTSDGLYRIDVTAFAWDTNVSQTVSIDCQVCNTREIVQEVELLHENLTHYEACWVAEETPEGYVPYLHIYSNNPIDVEGGTTVTVHIVFSGPMDTSVTPTVTFSRPGFQEVLEAVPDPITPWESKYLPDGCYDKWTGHVLVPAGWPSGWVTMSVEAVDNTGLGLLDPSDPDPEPPGSDSHDNYVDTHHAFGIAVTEQYPAGSVWGPGTMGSPHSSPCLGDITGDGVSEFALHTQDGPPDYNWLLEVFNGNGTWIGCFSDEVEEQRPRIQGDCYSAPAFADIDWDGQQELISNHGYGAFARESTGDVLPGWPVTILDEFDNPVNGFNRTPPVIGNISGDGHLETILTRVVDSSSSETASVFAFGYRGGSTPLWKATLGEDGSSIIAAPCVCDVDGDGDIDVLVTTARGFTNSEDMDLSEFRTTQGAVYLLNGTTGEQIWRYPAEGYLNSWIMESACVGDLDGDYVNEVTFYVPSLPNGRGSHVFILDGESGSLITSEELEGNWIIGSMALGDVSGNGNPDIVAQCNYSVGTEVYSRIAGMGLANNQLVDLDGFPVTVSPVSEFIQYSGPSIFDLDSDGQLEILTWVWGCVGTETAGKLYAYNGDGTCLPNFPYTIQLGEWYGQPVGVLACGEVDGDESTEIVFPAICIVPTDDAWNPKLWCIDLGSGSIRSGQPSWRQYQMDSWHSGCVEINNTVPAPPSDLDATDVRYNMLGYEADLEWTLSPNDWYSLERWDPCDVSCYRIYRRFDSGGYDYLAQTHAGDATYTDVCSSPAGRMVSYHVLASDGQNLSEPCEEISFPTRGGLLNLALNCMVIELREHSNSPLESSSRTTDGLRAPGVSSETHSDELERFDTCSVLTDGLYSQVYSPGGEVRGVVIDLASVCEVSNVEVISGRADPNIEMVLDGARYCAECSTDGFEWCPGSGACTRARYIRVTPAPSASEITVWGIRRRDCMDEARIDINHTDAMWRIQLIGGASFDSNIPVSIRMYDLAGRLLREMECGSGQEVVWDGLASDGRQLPAGCYLIQAQAGDDIISTRMIVF